MSTNQIPLRVYGLRNGLQSIFPSPIVALRAPLTSDFAEIGQVWIYTTTNASYILTSIVANVANWLQMTASGGAGVLSSLTVTPGPISLTGTTTINTSGSAVTTIGTGGTGAVNIGNATGNTAVTGSLSTTTSLSATTSVSATTTITAGTGITATTGNIAASSGNVSASGTVTAGTGITATTGNIAASSGNVSASGTVTGGTGVTATTGNITATDGNIVLSTAATYISMPGPVFIYSGSGAPSNGLALHVGDMYINTSAASATTRLYIATAASTWTNVTCAG